MLKKISVNVSAFEVHGLNCEDDFVFHCLSCWWLAGLTSSAAAHDLSVRTSAASLVSSSSYTKRYVDIWNKAAIGWLAFQCADNISIANTCSHLFIFLIVVGQCSETQHWVTNISVKFWVLMSLLCQYYGYIGISNNCLELDEWVLNELVHSTQLFNTLIPHWPTVIHCC